MVQTGDGGRKSEKSHSRQAEQQRRDFQAHQPRKSGAGKRSMHLPFTQLDISSKKKKKKKNPIVY